MSTSLVSALFLSVVMHLGLIIFGPKIHYADIPEIEGKEFEVEMVRREVPLPDALRPKPIPKVAKPEALDLHNILSRPIPVPPADRLKLNADPSIRQFEKAPQSRPLQGLPKLKLPRRVTSIDKITQAKNEPAPGVRGERSDLPPLAESTGLVHGEKEVLVESSQQYVGQELAGLTKDFGVAVPGRRQSIRGPVSGRRIIFRPPPPKAGVPGASGDITLRFWVLADGTVGRVIPVRKGNAYLEGIAANHMKRWRFTPLPPGTPEREEWGLIEFRFRIR